MRIGAEQAGELVGGGFQCFQHDCGAGFARIGPEARVRILEIGQDGFKMAAAHKLARGGGRDPCDDRLAEMLVGPDFVDGGGRAIDRQMSVPAREQLDGVIDIDVHRAAGNIAQQLHKAPGLGADGVALQLHRVEQADLAVGCEHFLDTADA